MRNNNQVLLTRAAFSEGVFKRDGYKCVLCGDTPTAAHHVLERKIWSCGGYYLDNGASVCDPCHIKCETTEVSVEDLRIAAGITRVIVPSHLYADQSYDKWGNPVLPNGNRLRGELFYDESVQKILAKGGVLDLFTTQVKYPRTHHVPWSEGINDDDRVIGSMDHFVGQRVIVTEKMDGENTSLYPDYIHARSIDGRSHPSRDWVKQFWSQRRADIPEDCRVCGENLYAKHSIHYQALPTYFMGFSYWNERNVCQSWDDTMEWFDLLDVRSVPVLYDGIYDEKLIRSLHTAKDWGVSEGYTIRLARAFDYSEFRHCIAKFVRKGHVQTVKHWMYGQPVEKNLLAS
jgi:hypothetical protein